MLYLSVAYSYLGKDVLTQVAGGGAKTSARLAVATVLLCGVVVWAAYQSTLTSELAVRTTRVPFSDLEGLLHSEYQSVSSFFCITCLFNAPLH